MWGNGAVRAWGVLLFGAGLAVAAEEPLPPSTPALIAPGGDGGTAVRPAAPALAARPGSDGPMLVVPGVNAPRRVRATTRLPALEPAGPDPSADLPALIGPGGTTGPRSTGPAPITPAPATAPGRPLNGLTLETVPGNEPVVSTPAPPAPRPTAREEKPVPPPPAPRRPSGLFGRMLTPPPFLTGRGAGDPRSSITVEPRTDPAADAALRRRIERQIQETLGDRVRSVEIRIVGRDVTIHARTARFWQRRSVRRTLETLPGLSEYHTTVVVDD